MTSGRSAVVPGLFCACVVAAVTVLWLTRPAPGRDSPAAGSPSGWAALEDPVAARADLATLPVESPSPEVAYDRVRDFGPAWDDVDHNGCDTRNDVLRRDLRGVTVRSGTSRCVVLAGSLTDPYTGDPIRFSKADATAVQIDHLVPLHAAWTLGAWRWTAAQRRSFANDPRNLVAVDGQANQDKSDALVDRWRPPDRRIWCVYAINTVVVHRSYSLAVAPAEVRALRGMLDRCGPARSHQPDAGPSSTRATSRRSATVG